MKAGVPFVRGGLWAGGSREITLQDRAGSTKMNNNMAFTSGACFLLLLGACSTSNSPSLNTGERISQRGSDIGVYGDDWSKGRSDVTKGQKSLEKSTSQLADGEKELARARSQVARAEQKISAARADRANGEKLIQDGNGRMQRAESGYSAIRSGPSAVTQ